MRSNNWGSHKWKFQDHWLFIERHSSALSCTLSEMRAQMGLQRAFMYSSNKHRAWTKASLQKGQGCPGEDWQSHNWNWLRDIWLWILFPMWKRLGFSVNKVHCWLDSSVALYWIRGQGDYKEFVTNCVQKINQEVIWRHVPTADNPINLGSQEQHEWRRAGGTVSSGLRAQNVGHQT